MSFTEKSFAVLWLAASLAIVVFSIMGQDAGFRMYYSNGVQVFAALLSAIMCYRTGIIFPGGTPLRLAWVLAGSGVLAWAVGQSYFAAYPLLHNGEETPYPSVADIGFLMIAPLMATALLRFRRAVDLAAPFWGKLLATIVFIVSLLIALRFNWDGFAMDDIPLLLVSLCYAVFDPILLTITVIVASGFGGSSVGKAWWYVVVGILLYYIGNLVYTNEVFNETYSSGSSIDIFWPLGFGFIALGAVKARNTFLED